MQIILNGEALRLNKTVTLARFLEAQGYGDMRVAVAVNGTFVPKSKHDDTILNADDKVEIVAPMQGG